MRDEERFVPGAFISPDVFCDRVSYLLRQGFRVVRLDRVIDTLEQDERLADAVVITFDDGLFSTYKHGLKVLEGLELPSTIYLTTSYFGRQTPVTDQVVRYMFWKTKRHDFDLTALGLPLKRTAYAGASLAKRKEAAEEIAALLKQPNHRKREEDIVTTLAKILEVNLEDIRQSRIFSIMTQEELDTLDPMLTQIEMHTHHHLFPAELSLARTEIETNRDIITEATGQCPEHFCYPDGFWVAEHETLLRELAVRSAATCGRGFAYPQHNQYQLPRILDSARVSRIEFEANINGFFELVDAMRRYLGR